MALSFDANYVNVPQCCAIFGEIRRDVFVIGDLNVLICGGLDSIIKTQAQRLSFVAGNVSIFIHLLHCALRMHSC